MIPIPATRYHADQRVRVRGRVWEIDAAPSEVETTQVLVLRDVQERTSTIEVIAEIETIDVLPPTALPKTLAPFGRWRDLHAAIACTMKPAPDNLGGFDQAKVRTEDYQLVPVIRAFDRPLQRILIADDVGLGKTVEAILILFELHARARADRVLILCPAGLQDQWRDEMLDKTGLEFEIYDSTRVLEVRQQSRVGQNPWTARRRIITSVDYAKRADVKRALRDVPWDLVIADEAHYLSETSSEGRAYRTERSRFAQFIADRTDSLFLLTATPHNGDPRSLYSLIELLDPALVASPESLSGATVAPVVVRRYKSDILDEQGRPRFKGIDVRSIPVPFGDERERRLYDAVVKYCRKLWRRDAGTAVGFAMTVIKKRLMSSRYALERTLEARLETLADEPLDLETKRGVLRDYREGAPLTEEQMEAAERQVLAAPAGDAEERAKERREIERLLRTSQAIPAEVDSKFAKLLTELQALHAGSVTGKPEKAIVFTEFRDNAIVAVGSRGDFGREIAPQRLRHADSRGGHPGARFRRKPARSTRRFACVASDRGGARRRARAAPRPLRASHRRTRRAGRDLLAMPAYARPLRAEGGGTGKGSNRLRRDAPARPRQPAGLPAASASGR